jgi:hypothetical protein
MGKVAGWVRCQKLRFEFLEITVTIPYKVRSQCTEASVTDCSTPIKRPEFEYKAIDVSER